MRRVGISVLALLLCLPGHMSTTSLAADVAVFEDAARTEYGDFTTDASYSVACSALLSDGHILSSIGTITQESLADHEVFLLPLLRLYTASKGITADEAAVIRSFVEGGGGFVFIGEHSYEPALTWHDIDNTVLNPLGSDQLYLKYSDGWQTVSDTSHPIALGPHGTVSEVYFGYAGVIEPAQGLDAVVTGPWGHSIATAGIGSGRAAFIMDASMLATQHYVNMGDNLKLWRNTFEYVPEPATLALLGLGGLTLIRRRKRHAFA